MDPKQAIALAATGISALLQLIAKLKADAGLTDDEVMTTFNGHSVETRAAISGYLANLPTA